MSLSIRIAPSVSEGNQIKTMTLHRILFIATSVSVTLAQAPNAPVIDSRGLINGFTKTPAPSTVARGGILHVTGLNLGPPAGVTASGLPLPTKLGNPEIQVLINGKAAPLFSVSSSRAVVQVPWDADLGIAQVVVTSGGVQSRTARFTIADVEPAVRTAADSGYGVAGTLSGQTLSLSASGLGEAVTAYIGGIEAGVSANLSSQRPGEFDVQITVPDGARAGDAVTLQVSTASGLRAANRTIFQGIRAPDLQFVPLPNGAPVLQTISGSDLNGNYLVATSARDEQGCHTALAIDLLRKTASKAADCLTSSGAPPVVSAHEGTVLGALIGPPPADAPPGGPISAKAMVFNPALTEPISVNLPAAAVSLFEANGSLAALTAGTPPQLLPIDSRTGAVGDPTDFGGSAPITFAPNGSPGGSTNLYAPTVLPQGLIAVIRGDDIDKLTRAEFAVLDRKGNAIVSKNFPDGWLPLVAPLPTAGGGFPGGGLPGGVQFGPGGPGGPGGAIGGARISTSYDSEGGVFYALSRAGDNSRHGLIAFTLDAAAPTAIPFPATYYAAACSPGIPFFSLAVSRRLFVAAGRTADVAARTPCSAAGFVRLDLNSQSISFVALQGQGQLDASPGSSGEMNNYVYGSSSTSDSLFVLDAVSDASFRLDLPAGITGFSGLRPVAAMSLLVGSATARTTGDGGLALFDLGNQTVTVLPVPDGFSSMSLLDVFTTTRKLVARGIKPGNAGSQFLIFDLAAGNLTVVPNSDGVAFVGPVPAQAGPPQTGGPPAVPSQTVTANLNANTAAAVALDRAGKQVGVAVLRIP
jgi:hypothetical protein